MVATRDSPAKKTEEDETERPEKRVESDAMDDALLCAW